MKKYIKKFIPIMLIAALLLLPAMTSTSEAETIVSPTKTFAATMYRVNITSGTLNCRTGPGTNYSLYGCLYATDTAIITGSNSSGTWLYLKDGGWVSAQYMKKV